MTRRGTKRLTPEDIAGIEEMKRLCRNLDRRTQYATDPEYRKEINARNNSASRERRKDPEYRARECQRNNEYRRKRCAEDPVYAAKWKQYQKNYYAKRCEDPAYLEEINRKIRERRATDPDFAERRRASARAYSRRKRELERLRKEPTVTQSELEKMIGLN